MKKLTVPLLSLIIPALALTAMAAENASRVHVTVFERDVPVEGASILINGNESGVTDAAGRANVVVDTGASTLDVMRDDNRLVRAQVNVRAGESADLVARVFGPGREAEVDITTYETGEEGRNGSSLAVEEVVAVAKYVPQSFDLSERDAQSVLDTISEQEIAIAGDSSAAAALQRVTGLTVVDGRFVYVRGLGERYSSTLLNGAELPSPDPSRRVVPLDLFPTDVLGGISIQKTYSPDMPGDFSGGVVQLTGRGVPSGFNGSIELSAGLNDQSFGEDGLSYEGGDRDYLGFDDGSRELSGAASGLTNGGSQQLSGLSAGDREAVAESLPNVYTPTRKTLPADFGMSFDIGDRKDFESWSGGYTFALLYDNAWRQRDELRRNIGMGGGNPFIRNELNLQRTDNEIGLGGVLGMAAEFGNNRLESFTLASRKTNDSVIRITGRSNDDAREIEETVLEWIETQLLVQQFSGEHFIGGRDGGRLEWQYTLSSAERDTPDRREVLFARTSADAPFQLAATTQLGRKPVVRSWEYLEDDNDDLGLSLAYPVTLSSGIDGEFKGGVALSNRDRRFDSVAWQFNLPSPAPGDLAAILDRPVEEQLTPENIGAGRWDISNRSSAADSYTAEQEIEAAYLLVDLWFGGDFRSEVGARFESTSIAVDSSNKFNPSLDENALVENSDLLPAINLTWFVDDASQLRFGASKTVNRPQFRELAPVLYLDPDTRFVTRGNADLRQAEIVNLDLRYERYWSANEGMSVALFYKDFTDPIEVSALGGGGEGLGLRTFTNVSAAQDYGLELEYREELDELDGIWQNFYVSGNVSLIRSSVELTPEEAQVLTSTDRELQGQSPWILNLQLGYIDIGRQLDAALSFNVSGERIVEVGQKGIPDAYEQPVPQLDFAVSRYFAGDWRLRFKARNLLDPEYEVEQAGLVQRAYRRGRSYDVSLVYEF